MTQRSRRIRTAMLLALALVLVPVVGGVYAASDGVILAGVLGGSSSSGGGYTLAPQAGPQQDLSGGGYTLGGRTGVLLPPWSAAPAVDQGVYLPVIVTGN